MTHDDPFIGRDEFFAQVALGHAARVTVVTPNRRLAAAIASDFDRAQVAAGLDHWETPDILPWSGLIDRLWSDAMHVPGSDPLPAPLTRAQETAIWESVIRRRGGDDIFLSVSDAAALAGEAWGLLHEWELRADLERARIDAETETFLAWAADFEQRCDELAAIDAARIPQRVAGAIADGQCSVPAQLVCIGFQSAVPRRSRVLESLASAGCIIRKLAIPDGARACEARVACFDVADESRRAAVWVRARLEANAKARIGIVVPELAAMREAVRRNLTEALCPGDLAVPAAIVPFNLSLGAALIDFPLVADALALLELCGRRVEFESASMLLRSPFLAGAKGEEAARARLDAWIRERTSRSISLDRLTDLAADRAAPSCPVLRDRLDGLSRFRREHLFEAQSPSSWARAFSGALATAGFPGERVLDSHEMQTLGKWHEVLTEFASLDRVADRLGFNDALARLKREASATLFQPESPDVPVQVLGALESEDLAFDHLWVMGLSEEAWPSSPRPNPLLPADLQRRRGLPRASAAAALERARSLMESWRTHAGELLYSHPEHEGDIIRLPSPLILDVAPVGDEPPALATHRDVVHAMRRIESLEDTCAPPLDPATKLHGGVALIREQALCAFRAFATQRLAADVPRTPHDGLDAMERGSLIHEVLAEVWRECRSRGEWLSRTEDDRIGLVARAVDAAIRRAKPRAPALTAARFAAVERVRLSSLAREWLDYETANREDFTVAAVEDMRDLAVGPLTLRARLDRVDELPDGRRLVIDYKLTAGGPGAWKTPRPDEPQLPIYLTSAEKTASGIAFAQVKTGKMKFVALASARDLVPGAAIPKADKGVAHEQAWRDQVEDWRREVGRLAKDFAQGRAEVDPKSRHQTCRNCGRQALCRIHERAAFNDVGEDDGDGA